MRKNFRTLILALLLQIFTAENAMAGSGVTPDDSCIGGINLFNALVANVTTLGLFSVYSANFNMKGAPGGSQCDSNYYGGVTHNSKGCAPGATGCSSNCDPNGGMTICYKTLTYTGITASNPTGLTYDYSCQEVQDGWTKTYVFPPATIRAKKIGDQLCAQFWTILGFQSMGCKYLPDCSQFALSPSCYVAQSCSNSSYQMSRSLVLIAGSIIQCVKESILRLFNDYTGCGTSTNYQQNYFPVFQDTMRDVVRAMLLLYVIFFGIKIMLGGEMPSKGEFFNFGTKFLLVLYFSVGFSTGYDTNGQASYNDGVTTFMLPFFQDGSTTLANIVYSAGGSQGLCLYNTQDYAAGYEYLALWDSIDCRLL
jgi:type IV secretion system protein VirB6